MTTQHNTTQHNTTQGKLRLFVLLIVFISSIVNSYAAGESCATAYLVVPDENFANQNYWISNTDKSVWFRFVANSSITEILTQEQSASTPYTYTNQIEIYSGTCAGLIPVQNISFNDFPGNNRSIVCTSLSLGQNYFIKITGHHSLSNIGAMFINPTATLSCTPTGGPTTTIASTSQLLASTLPTTVTGMTYIFQPFSRFIIDRDITFNTCKFIMYDGSKIEINGNAPGSGSVRLTINESWLSSCGKMWEGIKLRAGSGAYLALNNSVLEDAKRAIEVQSAEDFTVNVNSSIFNRNRVGIYSENSHYQVFKIRNSLFTSRNLFTGNSTLPVAQLKSSTISNFMSSPVLGYLAMPLKSPYNLEANSTAAISLVNNSNQSFPIGDPISGPTAYNLIDQTVYGVDLNQTSGSVLNNVIISRDGNYMPVFTTPYNNISVGIISFSPPGLNTYTAIIGGLSSTTNNYQANYFYNCVSSSILYNFANQNIVNNYLNIVGGFEIYPSRLGVTSVSNNYLGTIFGPVFRAGIRVNLTNTSSSSVTINNNTFGSLPGIAGIEVSNSIVGTNNSVNIFSNTLYSTPAQNPPTSPVPVPPGTVSSAGILLNTVKGATCSIYNNSISLLRNGILYGIRAISSEKALIHDNAIIGNTANGTTSWLSSYFMRGISVEQSIDCNVNCNYVGNVDQAITFRGICLNASGAKEVVFTNEMRNCYDGLTLEGGGRIGPQGTANSPSDNLWSKTGTWVWHAQAYSLSSPGSFSTLFVRNSAGYFPNPNSSNNLGQQFSLNSNTIGSRPYCAPCVGPNCNNAFSIAPTLTEMLKDDESNPEMTDENAWLSKKFVLGKLLDESASVTLFDSILFDFADSAKYANLGIIVETEQSLKTQNYSDAKSLSENLNPENQMEINFKIYNSLSSTWQMNPEMKFTTAQLADLNYVANQCESAGGETVLQARGFLNYLFANSASFQDDCLTSNTNQRNSNYKKSNNSNLVSEENTYRSISISPNPASKFVTIVAKEKKSGISLSLYNALGVLALSKTDLATGSVIDINGLSDGFYTYILSTNMGKKLTGKLIISNSHK